MNPEIVSFQYATGSGQSRIEEVGELYFPSPFLPSPYLPPSLLLPLPLPLPLEEGPLNTARGPGGVL